MTKVNINRRYFSEGETKILENGTLQVYTFIYPTGVEGVKVKNSRGYFVALPYLGQQIWEAEFDGHILQMESLIKVPRKKTHFVENYGCLLMHCGFTAMGVPQSDDNHPQHGELPLAEYEELWLGSGEDEKGKFVEVSGRYNYTKFFGANYNFVPTYRLYEDDTIIYLNVKATNMRSNPMDYMYLAHINYRPFENSKLIYSAKRDKEHIKVFKNIPDNLTPEEKQKLSDYMDAVEENPAIMDDVFAKGQYYSPEIVFAVDYEADEEGRAYSLQCLEDGYATYVCHPKDKLPVGVRWMGYTDDEKAVGMVLPATADHMGFCNAKRNGMIKVLGPGEMFECDIEFGLTSPEKTEKIIAKIERILTDAK